MEDTNQHQQSGKTSEKDKTGNDSCVLQLSLASYWLLAGLRIVLTILPQTGYIHPDEYFQSLEVVNGDIFEVESTRPWEFNVTSPIRSIALPYLYVGLPLYTLKNIAPFIMLWFGIDLKTPYMLLMVPRLMCCMLSFLTDYSLYKICYTYGQNYRARLLTLASSYVMLVYGTHTFSNSIEMSLASILIYLVADCMCRSDQVIYQDEYLRECYSSAETMREKVRLNRLRKSLPGHSLSSCIAIASVTVLGVFNRPTFLAFAFPPIFFWLHRGLGSKYIGLSEFHLRIFLLAVSALPMTAFLVVVDSVYYGYLTLNEVIGGHLELGSNFVVTPYNFIQYNAYTENLANHGLHPRITHILVNIPLLYNALGLAGFLGFLSIVYRIIQRRWSELPRVQSIIGLMTTSFIIPVALLSIFPHQEPRFLIPVTLPLVFLHSQRIRNHEELNIIQKQEKGFKVFLKKDAVLNKKDGLLKLWYVINILLTVFYGFIHQAGVYPLMEHFAEEMQKKPRLTTIHLVTSHIYPLPISLLHIKSGRNVKNPETGFRYRVAKDFFAYEMGLSDTVENAAVKLKEIMDSCEKQWVEKRLKYRLYIAIPTSLTSEFQLAASSVNMTHSFEYVFYPHLSTEAMPRFSLDLFQRCDQTFKGSGDCRAHISLAQDLSFNFGLQYFSYVVHQFGLSLIQIKK